MILRCLLAGLVGYVQVGAIALQVRLLAAGRRGWDIFAISLIISSIWCVGVLTIVRSPASSVAYAVSCAAGAVTAARLRLGERRVHSERLPRSLRKP